MEGIPEAQKGFDEAKAELTQAAGNMDSAHTHMSNALEKAKQIQSILGASGEQVKLVTHTMIEANNHARKHEEDIIVTSVNVVAPCTDATPGASDRLNPLYPPLYGHITDGEKAFTRTLRWLAGWHSDRFLEGIGNDLWHIGQHLPFAAEDTIDAKNSATRAASHIDEYRKDI